MSETMALATPPYPAPLRHKAGLLRRFVIGWGSWIHTLFEKSYRMKMGTVRFPLLRFFVINDLALVQDVLEEKRCPWPKHGLMTELLRPLMGQSVFSANGAQWQAQRAMINPAFAHAGLGRAFPAMRAAADAMAEQLHRAATQGPVDMERAMTAVTADVIFRTLFSQPLAPAQADAVFAAFARYQRHVQPYAMLRLYRLPLLGRRRRLARAAAEIRALFAPLVDARIMARGALDQMPAPGDILDALLDARHPHTGAPFARDDLLDQLATIFLAGHETSASALAWASYLVACDPALQDDLAEAIAQVSGAAALAPEHLKALPMLRHLFQETCGSIPGQLPDARSHPGSGDARQGDEAGRSGGRFAMADPAQCRSLALPPRLRSRALRPTGKRDGRARGLAAVWQGTARVYRPGFCHAGSDGRARHPAAPLSPGSGPGAAPEPISRLTLRARRGIPLLLSPRHCSEQA
jgi:cytochrome P450